MSNGKRASFGILAAVFLLGAVAGGGGALAWVQSDRAATIHEGKVLQKRRLRALTRKLDLDRDQHARVAAILADDDAQTKAIGREVIARCGEPLRAHESQVDDEIRAVLRPEQKRRFERVVEQRRKNAPRPL